MFSAETDSGNILRVSERKLDAPTIKGLGLKTKIAYHGWLIAVEIKSGQTFSSDFLKGLNYWRSLPGNADAPAALIYGGDDSYARQGIAVRSWRTWG